MSQTHPEHHGWSWEQLFLEYKISLVMQGTMRKLIETSTECAVFPDWAFDQRKKGRRRKALKLEMDQTTRSAQNLKHHFGIGGTAPRRNFAREIVVQRLAAMYEFLTEEKATVY